MGWDPHAGKRQTCRYWQTVETMMVWYPKPVKHKDCAHPNAGLFNDCAHCRLWEPSVPTSG